MLSLLIIQGLWADRPIIGEQLIWLSPILPRTSLTTISGTPIAVRSPWRIWKKVSPLVKGRAELLLNMLQPKLSIRNGLPLFWWLMVRLAIIVSNHVTQLLKMLSTNCNSKYTSQSATLLAVDLEKSICLWLALSQDIARVKSSLREKMKN